MKQLVGHRKGNKSSLVLVSNLKEDQKWMIQSDWIVLLNSDGSKIAYRIYSDVMRIEERDRSDNGVAERSYEDAESNDSV